MSFESVGIIGAGSWGTALALLLHGNGIPITMWGHDAERVRDIASRRENKICLPGVALPAALRLTPELRELRECDLLLVVTPSKAVREVAARLSASGVRDGAVLLSCTKGVERGSGLRMSEVIAEHFPDHPLAVLSGPSHAEEVARKMPTCVVLGCGDASIALKLQRAFTAPFFRAYTSDDIAGVEFGGALKNIFALAAGDMAGYESYARQIAGLLADEPRLLRDVFDALFHIAAADGIIHPSEDTFLRTVARIFGIGAAEFRSIRAAFVQETGRGAAAIDSPYDILGVEASISDAALKARHRQLVRDHHPDSLASRGVPPEFHAASERKLAVINAAYDAIQRARGQKQAATSKSPAQ